MIDFGVDILKTFTNIIGIIGNNIANLVDFIINFGKVLTSILTCLPYPLQPILYSLLIFLCIVIFLKVLRLFI